jgi:hypothetical protein
MLAGCVASAAPALATLLGDSDRAVRSATAASIAAAARRGYPHPLHPVLVDRLLQLLECEPHTTVLLAVIDALASSRDPRVPAALLTRIPTASRPIRERIVEAGALFAQLRTSAGRRTESSAGVAS